MERDPMDTFKSEYLCCLCDSAGADVTLAGTMVAKLCIRHRNMFDEFIHENTYLVNQLRTIIKQWLKDNISIGD